MRNGYSYRFRILVIALLCMLLAATRGTAQTDIPIGSGTTGNTGISYPCPLQDYYEGSRMQFLYLASELSAAGMGPGSILSISYNVTALNGAGLMEKMVVKVGGTSVNSLSSNAWDDFNGTPVETSPVDYQSVVGTNTISLPTAFAWNGSDNILVEICNGDPGNTNGTWYTNNPTIPWTTGLSFNGSHGYIDDNLGSLCSTTSASNNTGTQTTRPDITFSWMPASGCNGKPVAGTALTSAANVCLGQNFTLSLSGNTIASGITVQWQVSANNTTWSDIPGATWSNFVASQSATSWYRAKVICNNSASDTSTVVQVISPALVGGTYTINGAQATGGTNFQSFNDAVNFMKCGINAPVVFNVVPAGGPYTEQVTLPRIPGASAVNTITFNGNGATLSYSPTTSADRTALLLNGATHFIIDSLYIDVSGGTYGWGALLINKADSNVIKRCTFDCGTTSTSGNYIGLLINGSTTSTFYAGDNANGNSISGNTFIGGYYGIFGYGTMGLNVGNTIENNTFKDVYYGFIYTYGFANLTIRNNDLSRPTRSTITTAYGIYVGSSGAVVDRNRIHNLFDGAPSTTSTAYCIYISYQGVSNTQRSVAQNNMIYNINNGGGTIYGIISNGYSNWNFYHNTIILDDATATGGTTYGASIYGGEVYVKNNLIYVTRGGTGTKYCLNYSSSGVTQSGNNDLYINSPAGTNYIGYYNAGYSTLTAWQTTGFDQSSVAADPLFANASGGDYSPTSVFVDNLGAPVGVTTDLRNAPRSTTTPDIGALEFQSPPCTSPPVPGTLASSANPVCVGINFTLSLTGGTAGSGQTYQWQSSADNVTWTNITGAVSASLTTSQTASTWYKVAVTCSGTTVYSNAVQVLTTGVVYTTLPFTESFENTWSDGCDTRDIPNNFWRSHPTTGNNSWRRNDDGASAVWTSPTAGAYTPAASVGTYSARFHTYYAPDGSSGSLDLYVNANTGVATKRLRFDYINTTGDDSLQVFISTDGGATFTRAAGFLTQSAWGQKVVNFTSNSATTVIRFMATSDYGLTDIGIDNLSVFNLEDCTGTPVPGTTVSSSATVCPGTTFTLSVNGLPLQNGVTYQWQFSTDNTTWSNITGATGENYAATQNVTTWYRILVNCTLSAQTATSTPVQVVMRMPAYTSLPYTESFENTWINGCGTRDLPNDFWTNDPITGNNSWRRNDDGASANWGSTNGAYAPTASAGTYSARFHSYNAGTGTQGKFDLHIKANTGVNFKRLSFSSINTSGSDTLSIQLSTDGGVTFKRIDSVGIRTAWTQKTIYFNATSDSTVIRFLAVSDFGVTDIGLDDILVADWPDCSGTPNGGTATASVTTACVEPFTLSVTGVTTGNGISYQWQSSLDSTTWTNMPGATGLSTTTAQVGTHYYRLLVTCSLSNQSAPSSGVKVVSPVPVHGTFTINSSQATGGTNFTSFNDAYNYIKCGIDGWVLFNVLPGTGVYNEQLIMTPVPGASAVNTVTFKGDGVAAIGFGATNTNERAVIKLRGTAHIIFDSLIVNANTGTYGYGFQLMANTDSNEIKNCTIYASTTSTAQNFAGIVVNGTEAGPVSTGVVLSDYNNFSGNTIVGGYYGITLAATFASGANGNNKIVGNTIKDFYQTGIYVAGSYATLIEKNYISRPTRTLVTDFNGILFTTEKNAGCFVQKNRITNPFGGDPASTAAFYGINFTNSSGSTGGTYNENTVSNNLIYGINGNGLEYGIVNNTSGYAWYFHNTVSFDSLAATSTAATRGVYRTGTASGIYFYNNIINITRGGTGTKYAMYWDANLPAGMDNNDYFVNAAAGNNYIGYYAATSRAQINDWKTATNLEANSFAVTPAFTAPALGNYTPGNAGIDNKGYPIGIPDDILDQVRSATTPDVGAYEFTPSPCSIPLANGRVSITPDTICQYNPVYLHLNIGAFGAGQTFQWQVAKSLTGTFTNIGTPMLTPDTTIISDTTSYYRVQISCGANIIYTDTVQLVVNPALPTGTYTINKTLATNYIPGKSGGNFNSFNEAKAAMGCGIGGPVVFNVASATGPYNEQLILDSIPNTSAINTITFNGNGNELTYAAASTNQRATLKFNGADHIIFDSLVITATGTYGFGVQLVKNADSNIVRKCTINVSTTATTTSFAGIAISASDADAVAAGSTLSDGNRFEGNTINGGYYGITLVGSTGTSVINNNSFVNNTIKEFYNYGFYISGAYNTSIAGNNFTRPTRANTATTVYGLYIAGNTSDRLSVSKNRFHRFFGGVASTATLYGIYQSVGAAAGDTVTNNLLYDLDNNGPLYGIYNSASSNVLYFHNTISIDNILSTSTGISAGFYQTSAATSLQFLNNMITVTRGGTGSKYAIYLNAGTTSDVLTDYNNFYINGTNTYTGFYTANRAALADWQAATTKDAHSYAMNPLYTDSANGNYKPQLAALDNKGTNANVKSDILNVTRSTTTPDIGAYEFEPTPCQAPPIAGTAIVTPNTGLCLETPIDLTVTGHSPLGSITFQWQSSPNSNDWTAISPVQYFPQYKTKATLSTYFRAMVVCGSDTSYTPAVQVTLNNILLAGTYTIDKTRGTSLPNFTSFQAAVDAMLCGISGPVIFKVAADTYTEQIRIPYIPNTSSVNTVTFQSDNGVASSVNLTYDATSGANYTLKLDSTKYFTFTNITISGTNTTSGRVVEIAGSASYNNFIHCSIAAPVVTTASNTVVGIFANQLKGTSNVLRGNTITNGASGIYFAGTGGTASLSPDHVIDSNVVSGSWQYGIFTNYIKRLTLTNNSVTVNGTVNSTGYGIYALDCDSAYTITGNKVSVSNTSTILYGLAVVNCDSSVTSRGKVIGNNIYAVTGNTGSLYGLYLSASPGVYVNNNVVAINTSGASSYGLYHNNFSAARYYNNSIQSTATSLTNNYAAYIQNSTASDIQMRNNIYSHKGGGKALYVNTSNQAYVSDYNMLYTSGATLVQRANPSGSYATLGAWRAASYWDKYSITYSPAFVSNDDLHPDLANPDVWAMHGRGVQIAGNTYDYDNHTRPVALTEGVPDLGAYEFFPTAQPTVLTAIPALPAINTQQTFMYGTDTVMKITWGATAPATVEAKRFSGVVPAGLQPRPDSMFFYTQVTTPTGGNYDYHMELFYLDPWQGSIPDQNSIGLGKTTASNAWVVGFSSRVDVNKKKINENTLTWIDRFTGLINPYAPPVLPDKDSSNRGKRFWVGYQKSWDFDLGSNSQDMVLYMSTLSQPANVQIRVNGTNWVRNYVIPPFTTQASDYLPKTGQEDARLLDEGLYNRGVSIVSDVPITAYAHEFAGTNSGATMLFPTGVWGYEYYSVNNSQNYTSTGSYTTIMVIADRDNTKVEITPSVPTLGGKAANVAFTVTLNAGDVYQVLGGMQSGSVGYDLSGSIIKSVPNSAGECHPIAVFTGSSRTSLSCAGNISSTGDLLLQQTFPYSAWGKKYFTAPTSNSSSISSFMTNIYRVVVKDPLTEVKVNGTALPLSQLINGRYYTYNSNTADIVTADHPVEVVQYTPSANQCPNTNGDGDPDIFILSPAEQAVSGFSGFYRNNLSGINENYLALILPDGGMSSLKIDGVAWANIPALEKYSYAHSQPGYTVAIKRWGAGAGQSSVESDSAYLGLVYGLGSAESYGYNVGTMVKTLQGSGTISNTLNNGSNAEYTCVGTPFRFTAYLPFIPTSFTWKFSRVPGLSPNADVTVTSPTPSDSVVLNGEKNYIFPLNQDYTFAGPGVYAVEISYTHPDIESCDHSGSDLLYIQVVPAPKADFTTNFSGCVNDIAQFIGETVAQNGINVSKWKWTFHDGKRDSGQIVTYTYNTPGTYTENLQSITADGCIGDTTKMVTVSPQPVVTVKSIAMCFGRDTTLAVENPEAGAVYTWYSAATGGTILGTGPTLAITNLTANTDYYVQVKSATGCSSEMTKATVTIATSIKEPEAVVDSVSNNLVRFRWEAVPGASTYEVSLDHGTTWITPSSGATGLTHTVGGLQPMQTVTLIVRAKGACGTSVSKEVSQQVQPDGIFIPSGFTPNGDGLNDYLRVYGFKTKELKLVIFNQWGEKLFETSTMEPGWDGRANGKAQPSGVYMYVCRIVLTDGSTVDKRGAINLIR